MEDSVKNALQVIKDSLESMDRELSARSQILDAVAGEGGSWMAALDWRTKLRDFASDSEQHAIDHEAWKSNNDGIYLTLYSSGDFYTAYYDDAHILWEQSDDDLPMHHVMVRSDPPHRTCIHAIHLHRWLSHFAEICMPVRICSSVNLKE